MGNTETHKIAKSGGQFYAAHPKDGWLNSGGTPTVLSASPKKTKFFAALQDAKAAGFSPSAVQTAALDAWPKK